MNERRVRRSHDPYRALCLQLEHVRLEGDLDALVVAIDNGLLVAGAGERSVCEALGAVAPLVGSPRFDGPVPAPLVGQRIEVRSISLDGERVYVASVGRSSGDEWIARSAGGVRRILGYAPLTATELLLN
jgi:hypothetical protein